VTPAAITSALGAINRRLGTTAYLVEGPGFTVTIKSDGLYQSVTLHTVEQAHIYLRGWIDALDAINSLSRKDGAE